DQGRFQLHRQAAQQGSHGTVRVRQKLARRPRRRLCNPLRPCVSCGVRHDDDRAGGGAHAAEGPPGRAQVLHRRLEHQQQALPGVGRFQRGARVRVRRALVHRGGGGARLLLLLLLLPRRRQRQQLLLLAPGVRALAPAAARLHSRSRRRVRGPVRRAAQAERQHDGDAGLRGGPGGRRRGHHAQLHGPPGGGEDGGRRRGLAAPRRRAGRRRRRAPGGRGRRRHRRARGQQLPQDPDVAGRRKEGPDRRRGRDAGPRPRWLRVLVDGEEVACVHSGVSCMDHNYGDPNTVRHFPSPAQRDRRHLRGDGRVGGPAAGAGAEPHRAGRHPALRRRGGDGGGAAAEQGGELPAGLQAQPAALQRVERQRASAGRAPALLQPVGASRAAPLQPLQRRPLRPALRRRRGHRRRRAAGLAALRVPRGGGVGPGRGVLDGGAPDAGDVLADGRRGRPQRRAEAAVPGPGRRRELRDRAARVPDGGPARLPPAAAGQPPGVPGAARGVGGRDARRGRVARALPGAAAAAGQRAVQGVAVQAPHRGQGAAQQPQTAVQASVAVV
uniref:Uncharacterized protein n=1 Tax=Zea mays TaxID=4577 RepID=A0A804PV34_MAIZE